jgi:hypothetical protein
MCVRLIQHRKQGTSWSGWTCEIKSCPHGECGAQHDILVFASITRQQSTHHMELSCNVQTRLVGSDSTGHLCHVGGDQNEPRTHLVKVQTAKNQSFNDSTSRINPQDPFQKPQLIPLLADSSLQVLSLLLLQEYSRHRQDMSR